MSVNFVDGNIFSRLSTNKTTYICQQVNCKGVMGAGLAMQICIQWPVVYRRYLEFCHGNDGNKLGTYQEVLVEPKLYVVNLFGQNGYSRGERQTNYATLAAALFSFFRDCAQKYQDVTIRLPYGLGCGFAGGDWDTVLPITSDLCNMPLTPDYTNEFEPDLVCRHLRIENGVIDFTKGEYFRCYGYSECAG